MNIFDYLYESNGIHYFKEPTTLTIADIDKDQIYRGQAQKNFDKGKSYDPLPVLIFPDANPNPLPNEVFRWNGEKYYLDYDYRGQVFYEKATGNEVTITEPGALPFTLTAQKYPGEFYYWDEQENTWALNEQEKAAAIYKRNHDKKLELFNLSREKISLLTDMVEIMGDESYAPQLTAWQTFQLKLKAITDLTQENIVWPEIPNFSKATEEV